jgi:hypothetical protein
MEVSVLKRSFDEDKLAAWHLRPCRPSWMGLV